MLDNNELTKLELNGRMSHLNTLSLNNNRIADLDELLATLQRYARHLRYVSLLGNPCSPDLLANQDQHAEDIYTSEDYTRHRLYVLHMLPKLQFLDSSGVSPRERAEAKRRGRYCRTARLVRWDAAVSVPARAELGEDVLKTPLTRPPVAAAHSERRGPVEGKLTYRYIGKHSEGNRFIRSKDL